MPLDAINGSPLLCCELLPNSDTKHKQLSKTSEDLAGNVFNLETNKQTQESICSKRQTKRLILHYTNVMDNCITVSISMYYIHCVSIIVISNANFVSFFFIVNYIVSLGQLTAVIF